MADSTTIVIFGASGDLTQRKLIPALFNLFCKQRLPANLRVVGFAATEWQKADFRAAMRAGVEQHAAHQFTAEQWSAFEARLFCRSAQGIAQVTTIRPACCATCSRIICAAPRPDGDGAAGRVRRRFAAQRKGQGAQDDSTDSARSGRGAYGARAVSGILRGRGRRPDSHTSTYTVLRHFIDNWRWQGVPFYLRSGKRLAEKTTEIVIQFKCPPHLMFPLPPDREITANILALCLQPDEGIHLRFEAKVPDTAAEIRFRMVGL